MRLRLLTPLAVGLCGSLGACIQVQPVPYYAAPYGSPAASAAAAGAVLGGLVGAAVAESNERRYYYPPAYTPY